MPQLTENHSDSNQILQTDDEHGEEGEGHRGISERRQVGDHSSLAKIMRWMGYETSDIPDISGINMCVGLLPHITGSCRRVGGSMRHYARLTKREFLQLLLV